jgi:hypothetical protein
LVDGLSAPDKKRVVMTFDKVQESNNLLFRRVRFARELVIDSTTVAALATQYGHTIAKKNPVRLSVSV